MTAAHPPAATQLDIVADANGWLVEEIGNDSLGVPADFGYRQVEGRWYRRDVGGGVFVLQVGWGVHEESNRWSLLRFDGGGHRNVIACGLWGHTDESDQRAWFWRTLEDVEWLMKQPERIPQIIGEPTLN